MLEEGELVGLAADGGLHVEVVELVRGSGGGRVDEAPPVDGDVGLGPVEALLLQHRDTAVDAVLLRRNAEDVAAPQGHVAVGDDDQLFARGQP